MKLSDLTGTIAESSMAFQDMLNAVQEYASIAEREGEDEAADVLMQQGFSVAQIQTIARSYKDFLSLTGRGARTLN